MRRIPAERRTLELAEARDLSPTVRELVLRTADGASIDYLAGQWIKLHFENGIDRDYSISSAPDPEHPDRIELAVTRVEGGPGSEALHRMKVGERLETLGPNGLFVREESHLDVPAIYVGTGTGLAPLRAMLQEELRRGEGAPQLLLFGCRTEEELLWRSEIERWRAEHPRFQFVPTLSRAPESWSGLRGWVQTHLPSIAPSLVPAHVYVCGLSRMVGAARTVLKEQIGLDRRFVHSERYD